MKTLVLAIKESRQAGNAERLSRVVASMNSRPCFSAVTVHGILVGEVIPVRYAYAASRERRRQVRSLRINLGAWRRQQVLGSRFDAPASRTSSSPSFFFLLRASFFPSSSLLPTCRPPLLSFPRAATLRSDPFLSSSPHPLDPLHRVDPVRDHRSFFTPGKRSSIYNFPTSISHVPCHEPSISFRIVELSSSDAPDRVDR